MRLTVSINEQSYQHIKQVASEKNISAAEYIDALITAGIASKKDAKKTTVTNHEAWVERKIFEIVILARVILREHINNNDERLFRYINDAKRHAEEMVGKRLENYNAAQGE